MKKLLKSIACFATAALVGASAFANYDWYDTSIGIGGITSYFSQWSRGNGAPDTDLGALTSLTISGVEMKIWDDSNDRGGVNMFFRLYGDNGQIGGDVDVWLGAATRITGDHDFSISYTGPFDLADAFGVTLEEGKTYYLNMWAKSYGDAGDHWYNGDGDNYHTKFVYYANPQKVTFDANGGQCDIPNRNYQIGVPYGELPTPTLEDHALIGWFDADTGERVKAKYDVPDQATRTLVAEWGAPQTVTFDPGEGECSVTTMTFAYGGKYEDMPTPSWEGHTFAGWYDAAGVRAKNYYPVTDESSRTLIASWKGLKQTVYFDADGGDCSKDSVQCFIGESYYGFPTPTLDGHTFVGWYDDDTGIRYKNYMKPVTDDAELYLTAHWKGARQTVHFDAGEGATCSPDSVKCYIGETYIGFPTPTLDGSTFRGWYDAEGTRYKNYMRPVTEDPDLYLTARWQESAAAAAASLASRAKAGARSTTLTDTLTATVLGLGGSYTDFTGIKATSDAIYAGNAMSNSQYHAIQMRSSTGSQARSGIVTTNSGGVASKVTVVWNSSASQDARIVNVYGKGTNSAYSSVSDLYDASTQGDLIGSLKRSEATNLTSMLSITGEYAYIGLKSSTGALYLDSIAIEWAAGGDAPSVELVPSALEVTVGETLTITATANNFSGTVDWEWVGDDDGSWVDDGNTSIYTVDTSAEGTYEVLADATYGTENASDSVTVKVNAPPSPTVTLDPEEATVRIGATLTIAATAANFSGDVTWKWFLDDVEDVAAGNTSTYTVNTTEAGVFGITAQASYGTDESATADAIVTVQGPHEIVVSAGDHGSASAPSTAYPGETVTVTATPDEGYTLDTIEVNYGEVAVDGTSFVMPDDIALVEVSFKENTDVVYTLVESMDDFEAGADYLVVAYSEDKFTSAMKNEKTGNRIALQEVTIVGNTVTVSSDADYADAIVWTIAEAETEGKYTLYNAASNVYAAFPSASSKNEADLTNNSASAYAQWTLDVDEDSHLATIGSSHSGKSLARNSTVGNAYFANYTSGTKPFLFKAPSSVPMQTVTFDPDGGECDPLSARYVIGETYGTLPTPTKDGFALIGWFDADTGERVKAKYEVPDQATRSLVASWGAPQVVTFDMGEGAGEATCPFYTMVSAYGGKYEDMPKPTWEGHTFVGWYDAEGNRVKDYYLVTDESTRTLIANWKGLKQTIHFDAGDGECDTDSVQCFMGGSYIGFPTPTWEGHSFVGWYDDATGIRYKNYMSPVTDATDLYLTAHWKGLKQTVHFDAGEGQCDKETVQCYIGETYIGFPSPTWEGHIFRGWYDAEGTRFKNYMKPVTEDLDLYLTASWKESASASSLAITAFEMKPRAASPATRSASPATVETTLWFGTIAGTVYEVQWAPAVDGEWIVLKRWTADEDGEMPVTVDVPVGASGFFRLVQD